MQETTALAPTTMTRSVGLTISIPGFLLMACPTPMGGEALTEGPVSATESGESSSTGEQSSTSTGQGPELPSCVVGAQPIVENSLEATIELLGEAGVLQVDVPVTVDFDIVIPNGIDVCFIGDGRFEIAVGVTVVIGGHVQADPMLIFDYADDTSSVIAPQLATIVPQWWGAKGDNATNDTDALRRAADFISIRGGGTLLLPTGTYVVGEQSLAGSAGLGGSWLEENIIYIHDCLEPVVIEGQNGDDKTVLRAADGLRYGSFDPVAGGVHETVLPFTKYDYRADVYWGMVALFKNSDVSVRNLELDGNQDGLELGGLWGDKGYQVAGSGIWAYQNDKLTIEDVHAHHQPLDGLIVGYAGLMEDSAPTPTILNRVVSEFNGRQGLSWVGGIGLTATDCRFNHSGRARIASSPAAGLDIEAEGSICRDGKFFNSEFINNVGVGMVADSGDGGYSTFSGCTFWGTTNWSVWARKPRLIFEDSKIYGSMPQPYSAAVADDMVRFSGCTIEDLEHPEFGVYRNGYLVHANSQHFTIEDSKIIAHKQRALYFGGVSKERLINVDVTHGDDSVQDKSHQSVIRGTYLENVRFHEEIDSSPANGWYISHDSVTVGPGVFVDGPDVKWGNWSWGIIGEISPN